MTAATTKAPRGAKSKATGSLLTRTTGRGSQQTLLVTDYLNVYQSDRMMRVITIKRGIPATDVGKIALKMDSSKDKFYKLLKLSHATVDRKARAAEMLSSDDSARVLGIAKLIGQVESMVRHSGNPEGFDAAKWLSHWLDEPIPALAGQRPGDFVDTIEGQEMVSNLIAMMQSGSYA